MFYWSLLQFYWGALTHLPACATSSWSQASTVTWQLHRMCFFGKVDSYLSLETWNNNNNNNGNGWWEIIIRCNCRVSIDLQVKWRSCRYRLRPFGVSLIHTVPPFPKPSAFSRSSSFLVGFPGSSSTWIMAFFSSSANPACAKPQQDHFSTTWDGH